MNLDFNNLTQHKNYVLSAAKYEMKILYGIYFTDKYQVNIMEKKYGENV